MRRGFGLASGFAFGGLLAVSLTAVAPGFAQRSAGNTNAPRIWIYCRGYDTSDQAKVFSNVFQMTADPALVRQRGHYWESHNFNMDDHLATRFAIFLGNISSTDCTGYLSRVDAESRRLRQMRADAERFPVKEINWQAPAAPANRPASRPQPPQLVYTPGTPPPPAPRPAAVPLPPPPPMSRTREPLRPLPPCNSPCAIPR